MRIFCAVRHSTDPRRYYGGLWSANFYPALRELGHEVIESQTDLLPVSRFMHIGGNFTPGENEVRARITQAILDEVRNENTRGGVDLVLSYFYNAQFDSSGFDELRSMGIPSINFFCNSIYQFELVSEVASKADFSWHAERDAKGYYQAVGANPVWVQMAADPNVYRPVEGLRHEPIAVFVGQRYADRDRLAAAMLQAKIPMALYGPGWKQEAGSRVTEESANDRGNLGRLARTPGSMGAYFDVVRQNWADAGPVSGTVKMLRQQQYRRESRRLTPLFSAAAKGAVPFEDQRRIFSSAELVLNFSNVWSDGRPGSALIPHVRLRDFEAPMCRSCYLTGDTDEIHEFYEVGKEIDTYRSSEELIEKSRFYLSNPRAAENLREAGYQRARAHHTWSDRFKELFKKVGLC